MDYIMKHKMLFWLIALLVILNLATIGTMWFGRPPHPGHMMQPPAEGQMPRPHRGMNLMKEHLQLSDQQAEKFNELREEHFERTRAVNDAAGKLRFEILDEIFSDQFSQEKVDKMLAELKELQGNFDSLLFKHFAELRDQCDPEQKEILKDMFTDLLRSTQRGGPGQQAPGMRPGMQGPGMAPGMHHPGMGPGMHGPGMGGPGMGGPGMGPGPGGFPPPPIEGDGELPPIPDDETFPPPMQQ